jgi:hypothetical protein
VQAGRRSEDGCRDVTLASKVDDGVESSSSYSLGVFGAGKRLKGRELSSRTHRSTQMHGSGHLQSVRHHIAARPKAHLKFEDLEKKKYLEKKRDSEEFSRRTRTDADGRRDYFLAIDGVRQHADVVPSRPREAV